jgi:GNAT superfamily N-acetyltransferase
MGIVVREANRADRESFLTLLDALADYEQLPRPTNEAKARLSRDGFEDPRRFQPYVAELDERVVAYAITYLTYSSFLALPTLYLEDLFVMPEARRHGVGGAIFRHLAAEAVRLDCGRMEWMVLDWNRLAIDFYERRGADRMSEWLPYRLDRDRLRALARGGPR